MNRCDWVGTGQNEIEYHDKEWGVPVHDDRLLFEMLILEGAQAGLSWSTILNKRKGYIKAFDGFDPLKISEYREEKIQELLLNKEIVRNKLKIRAAKENARRFLEVQYHYGSFDSYLWSFVDGNPKNNSWKEISSVPVSSKLSDKLSTDLKKKGFKFVGTTICYSYMQAIGMINDHLTSCFRYEEIIELQKK